MQTSLTWRASLLMATLLAFATGWGAPSVARASCGDGVGSLHDANKDDGPFRKRAKDGPATKKHAPNKQKMPCDGPACSRGQSPLVPAVPPVPPSSQEWLCLSGLFLLAVPADIGCPPYFTFAYPTPHPDVVFHPPREVRTLCFV